MDIAKGFKDTINSSEEKAQSCWVRYWSHLERLAQRPRVQTMMSHLPPGIRSGIHSFLLMSSPSIEWIEAEQYFFNEKFEILDANTEETLEDKYIIELPYWHGRFGELKKSIGEHVFGVFDTFSWVFALPTVVGFVGAIGLVPALTLSWWYGIPIFVGITLLTWILVIISFAAVLYIRGSHNIRKYAGVLLVNSLLQTRISNFEAQKEMNADKRQEKKEEIINGIEEVAQRIRHLACQPPTNDKTMRKWYSNMMYKAASDLMDLRQSVIQSRSGYSEKVEEKCSKYFDAAMRGEYGGIIQDVKISDGQEAPLGKIKQVSDTIINFVLTVNYIAFLILLVIFLIPGQLLTVEPVAGSGILSLLSIIYQRLGGLKGIMDKSSSIESFVDLVEDAKTKRPT